MRITCPNCGAQYEVAAGVIPEGGREVQCSDCNHLWFVPGPESAAPEAVPQALPEPEAEPEPEPEAAPEPEPAPAPIEPQPAAPPASPPPAAPRAAETAPPRPALSAEVAAILREEAERERAARAADRSRAPVIETQGELGLESAVSAEAQRADEARRRMARLRSEPAPDPAPAAAAPVPDHVSAPVRTAPVLDAVPAPQPSAVDTLPPLAAGQSAPAPISAPNPAPIPAPIPAPDRAAARARLPDIEEINSSLRAAADRAPAMQADAAAADGDGRAFRYGFSLVLILATVATAVYVLAGQIGAAVPALAGPLDAYAARVDDLRLWLDLSLQSLLPGDDPQAAAAPATDAPPAAPATDAPAAPAAPEE